MKITRREMAQWIGSGAVGLSLAPLLAAKRAKADTPWGNAPLVPKAPTNQSELPAEYQGIEFLALPPAFNYAAYSITGQTMSDGNPVPPGHDGMAAFPGPHPWWWICVRNHELRFGDVGVVAPDHATYNPALRGGTTTLVFDDQGRLRQHYGSLAGTERNCAGGPTPWGSWLTCEETFATREGVRHGYIFDVPANGYGDPMPLTGLGRFSHEAAAVDPATGYVYLTEDRGDSAFYRFIPSVYGDLHSPGQLSALRIRDWPDGVNTRRDFLQYQEQQLSVDWVPIDTPDPDEDTVRAEAASKGAAIFSRGEGCWYGDYRIYFVSTNGGEVGGGQIFAYEPRFEKLMLFVESTDRAVLDAPDNICVGPEGLLYMFEDGGGQCNIVVAEHDGSLSIFANNIYNGSELAGGCFSPNMTHMIVNMQSPGLTCVIEGPWKY